MNLHFIDFPKYVEPKVYEKTVDRMVSLLSELSAVSAIYRLGNVNHPGISDLDLIVVFKDDSTCDFNPNEHFSDDEKYLITHDIAGASVSDFHKILPYTFWDNLKCIWSAKDESETVNQPTAESHKDYKAQIALEFLVKNYIELSVQQKYGVVKLRSILQEIKAVRYDVAFLNIEHKPLLQSIEQLLQMLDQWFEQPFNKKAFCQWLQQYYGALSETLALLYGENKMVWLPKKPSYNYGRNVTISNGQQYRSSSRGLFLPPQLLSNKRLYNAHLRLNSFHIDIPFTSMDPSGLQSQRVNMFKQYKERNKASFPHFGALHSSLVDNFI